MRLRNGFMPAALVATAALAPGAAQASFLPPEVMDTAAMVLAWIVIVVAPLIAIGLFLVVHVLPEKIAEHNHHPQQGAIKTLCFLSLVFGGLLWPIAWLWAYTRPIGYRLAYGTDKHEHYFTEMGEKAANGRAEPAGTRPPARRAGRDGRGRTAPGGDARAAGAGRAGPPEGARAASCRRRRQPEEPTEWN